MRLPALFCYNKINVHHINTHSDTASKYMLTQCQNSDNIQIKELTQCQKQKETNIH